MFPQDQRSSALKQLFVTARVNHAAGLSSAVATLLDDDTHADLVIKVGDATFPAHQIVLEMRCDYLSKKVIANLPHRELELTGTSPAVFKKMLQYIYTAEMTLRDWSREDTLGLFQLAGLYGFSPLQESIAANLTRKVTNENAVAMLEYVISHPNRALQSLENQALRCILNRGVDFLESHEFLALSVECVNRLLRCWWDVPKPEKKKALQRWLESNGATGEKREHLFRLVEGKTLMLVKRRRIYEPIITRNISTAAAALRKIYAKKEAFESRLQRAQQETFPFAFRPGSVPDDPSPLEILVINDPTRSENPNKMKTTEDDGEREDWNEDLVFRMDDCGSTSKDCVQNHHFQMNPF